MNMLKNKRIMDWIKLIKININKAIKIRITIKGNRNSNIRNNSNSILQQRQAEEYSKT